MDQIAIAIKALIASPKLSAAWAVVTAFLVHIFGLVNAELMLLTVYLVLIDALTGIPASRKEGELVQSRKLFRTVVKVVVYFSFYGTVGIIGRACLNEETSALCHGLMSDGTLQTMALLWVMGIEVKSIIENLARLGFKIPAKIQDGVNDIFKAIGNARRK